MPRSGATTQAGIRAGGQFGLLRMNGKQLLRKMDLPSALRNELDLLLSSRFGDNIDLAWLPSLRSALQMICRICGLVLGS